MQLAEPKHLEKILRKEDLENELQIILYNDDHNTFQWVIFCLIKYCKHTHAQAEQCAMITHTKGKCSVKNGTYARLQPICEALLENNLKAKIE